MHKFDTQIRYKANFQPLITFEIMNGLFDAVIRLLFVSSLEFLPHVCVYGKLRVRFTDRVGPFIVKHACSLSLIDEGDI